MFFIFLSLVFSEIKDVDMCISVDAGSSSTKLYIYAWNTSGRYQYPIPAIVGKDEVHKSVSTAYYDEHVVEEVFGQLIKSAEDQLNGTDFPYNKIDFFVYFTTAVRNLALTEQVTVINRTYQYIREHCKFNITINNLDIIDPVEEGIYTWITVNILTQRLGSTNGTFPVAAMGTSSTSLVFEFGNNKETKYEPYKYTVNINSINHTLFCLTNQHLGIDSGLANHTRSLAASIGRATITTPCYLTGYSSVVGDIEISGSSNMVECSKDFSEYTLIRNPSSSGSTYNTYDGIVLPYRMDKPMYATSVFAYAADTFGWPETMTLEQQKTFAKDFCSLSEEKAKEKYPDASSYINVYCAQMTYTNDYLENGYGVPLNSAVHRITKIAIAGSNISVPLDYIYGTVLSRAYGGALVIKEAKKKFSTVAAVIISVIVGAIVIGVIVFIVVKIRKKKQEKDEEGGRRLQEQMREQSSSLDTIRDPNEPMLSV